MRGSTCPLKLWYATTVGTLEYISCAISGGLMGQRVVIVVLFGDGLSFVNREGYEADEHHQSSGELEGCQEILIR